jgi:hypothetical protein
MRFCFRAVVPALFLTLGFVATPLQAKAGDAAKLFWITPGQEQALIAALPPMPPPGSPEDQADLAAVLKAQAQRTPQQAAQVMAEAHATPKLFQAVLGPSFSPEHEPRIYGLIEDAARDSSILQRDAKAKWQRLRPFRGHPAEVHPVYQADGLSYPSGHATFAYVCAVLLADIFPAKKDALLQEAAQIAQDRVIGGVHYPSDIAAGEKFGRSLARLLQANPDFQTVLAQAKQEAAAPAPAP